MGRRGDRADAGRGAAAAAALLVGVLAGGLTWWLAEPADLGPVQRAELVRPAGEAAPAAQPEHSTILEVIRDHRRQASETWRRALADAIYAEAREAAVDPLLVTSIVAHESSFRSRVVSHRGAVGLMQLRPFVARDLAERHALDWNGLDTLHDPTLNVRLGISYYKELVERFEGDEVKALTAYNYGPTRVSQQLREGTYRGSRYARDILDFYGRLSAVRSSGT